MLFETLQPGLAAPLPPVPTSARAGKLSFGWFMPGNLLMTEKGSIQPMSWAQSSSNSVVIGLCYPLTLLALWAELSFCLTGTGCKVVIKSEQKNRFFGGFVSSQFVGHASLPTPLQHQAHSTLTPYFYLPCMHFLSYFLNNCNLSFYCRCCPKIGNDCFVHVPANHHTICISVFLFIKCLQVLNDFVFT